MIIPTFSRLGITIRLLRIMPYVCKKEKSKMAAYNRKLIWNNVYHGFGISFLSCIYAEICVISYIRPVNGSHLWFIPYSYIGHSSEYFSRVARPLKHGHSRWNFVAITYTIEDTSVIYVLPVHGRHFIFDMDFCHLLFLLSAATLLSWKT